MNDFIGRNIKFIAEYGQYFTGFIIILCLMLAYLIVRKNKYLLPKGILKSLAFTLLLLFGIFTSLVFARITQIRPNVLPILAEMDALIGRQAPALNYTRVFDGKPTSLKEQEGKVLLVNYWATWCKPCLKEIPDLKAIEAKYKAKGLKVLMISDEEVDRLQKFAKKFDITLEIGTTPTFDWAKLGNERPATFIIDKNGVVLDYYTGARDFEFFDEKLKDFLL